MSTVLLQSTFTCLLEVTLGPGHRLQGVRALDRGRGVYFGLSRAGSEVYVAARNVDANGQVADAGFPTNTVLALPWPDRGGRPRHWSVPQTQGVHQVRFHDGLLWVMSCREPQLVAFDPTRGAVAGGLALDDLVPAALRHETPKEHPGDCFHFNSLYFSADRLFVLAHNWGYGSFALELHYPGAAGLLSRPRLVGLHTGLGKQAHDVFADRGRLYVLDSGGGTVLLSGGGGAYPVGSAYKEDERHCFARGFAVGGDFLYVGHGSFGKREERVTGLTQITVLDRHGLGVAAVVDVGPFGNPCDLLLVSEPDWSDMAHPPRAVRHRGAA